MSFHALSYATTLLTAGLAVTLFVAPDVIWSGMLIEEPTPQLRFGGRRSACLFLGLACISFSLRGMPPSDMRALYCRSIATAFTAVAALGLWELYVNHMAKPDIWGPVIVEVLYSLAFVYFSFENPGDMKNKRT